MLPDAGNDGGDRHAAVLIALYPDAQDVRVVYTLRRSDLRVHPGQISFPGGSPEAGESLEQAALREAWEEIGLAPDAVRVTDALPPVSTVVSGFLVHPFIATIDRATAWTLSEAEVDAVLEPSVAELRAGYARRSVQTPRGSFAHGTYLVDGGLIWGATARITTELLRRLA